MSDQTVRYHAISMLSSRTMWMNAVALFVAILSLTEVLTIIPPAYMPAYSAIVAILNLVLRTQTVRPVAMIAPGDTKAVSVQKLGPPDPAPLSD